jgi:hypothetical protein
MTGQPELNGQNRGATTVYLTWLDSQNRTIMVGQTRQESEGRTAKKDKQGKNSQGTTAKSGQ